MKIYAYIALIIITGIGVWAVYHAGGASCRAEVAERDNKALIAARKQIADLTARVEAQTAQHVADMATIQINHEKELSDATKERDQALADVRSGRLRYARACPSGGSSGPGSKAGPLAGTSTQADADRRAETDAKFLIDFAFERDQVALERNECVGIAVKDRR